MRRSSALVGLALGLGCVVGGLSPAPARAQDLPPLEVLLQDAETREDTLAIREAYEAARSAGVLGAEDPAPRTPREGAGAEPEPDGGAARQGPIERTPSATEPVAGIPDPDDTFRSLLGSADTAAAGRGPVTYRGERLVFYPETEVIVLEGADAMKAVVGQAGTELEARRILSRNREGTVEAFGQAAVSRGPSRVTADSLFYDRRTGTVATFGLTDIAEEQSQTQGADVLYDLERRSGRIGAGRTIYEPWILDAARMNKVGASTFVLEEGFFTTCDLEDPHYTFRADEIKLRRDDVIVAQPVVLYFSDIPVFYLPWYVEPVTRGRQTGFLRPKIGLNSLLFGTGKERNVQDIGFYWVVNEYADALLAADWYTESRFILRLDTRYHLRHEFRGSAHVEQVWNRLDDSNSRLVRVSHDHTFGLNSRARVDVNWSNSRSFLRRNSFDPEEILQRSFRSAGSYSTRFDWGSLVAGSSADFRLDQARTDFQIPDIRISVNQRPLWGATGPAVADAPWYRRLQYSTSGSFTWRLTRAQVDSLGNPVTRAPVDSLGQAIDVEQRTVTDEQQGRGQFTLNGPLDLGVIKANPSMSYGVNLVNERVERGEGFGGSGQLTSGLSLSTKFFRIFGTVPGPWFSAMRHTVSPAVSFNYSPRPNLFGGTASDAERFGQERFTASMSLGQDFEVKMPVRREEPEDAPVEGEAEDDADVPDDADRPREEPETRSVNLLSVTNSMNFDILEQRKEDRLGFGNLSTRLTSGIGRDFNVSVTMEHELVERGTGEESDALAPFLSRMTTDFSISRGGTISVGRQRGVLEDAEDVLAGRGADERTEEARESLASGREAGAEGLGPWSLSLAHQWTRTRDGDANRQSLGLRAQLLPTPSWSLNYSTTYDITNAELQAQTLSLVRDLHDWQATLGVNVFPSDPQDRILISFSVFLRDVPDFEIPYRVRRE